MLVRDQVRKYGWEALAAISTGKGFIEPNAHAFYVDKGHENALDANDGEHGNHWDQPFATIAYAITRSNANSSSYHMNTILVAANTYTENLTVLPKNCNIVAIGARTRITGKHVIASSSVYNQNTHFWNFWFRGSGAYPTFDVTAMAYYTIGWHNCTFEGTSSVTANIKLGNVLGGTIEDCRFEGNPLVPTAIWTVGQNIRLTVRRNYIEATDNGILIGADDNGYGNIICDNYIGRVFGDANATTQLTVGINMTHHSKYQIVNNRIEAADAIYGGDNEHQLFPNQCIANRVGQAGAGTWEDAS